MSQINSVQDFLTQKKRQIVAATFTSNPPPAHRRYNYVYTAVSGNKAMQFERKFVPGQVYNTNLVALGPVQYTNLCCLPVGTTSP
jgi:hypothetical protein